MSDLSCPPSHIPEAERLRADFDRSFTLPPPQPGGETADYVLVEAGPARVALAAGALSGIEPVTELLHVPSRSPALAGLAAVRSRIVPVFSLAGLLGEASTLAGLSFFALVPVPGADAAEESVGVAFDRLVHFVRMDPNGTAAGVRHEGRLYTVLDRAALHDRILLSPAASLPASIGVS